MSNVISVAGKASFRRNALHAFSVWRLGAGSEYGWRYLASGDPWCGVSGDGKKMLVSPFWVGQVSSGGSSLGGGVKGLLFDFCKEIIAHRLLPNHSIS